MPTEGQLPPAYPHATHSPLNRHYPNQLSLYADDVGLTYLSTSMLAYAAFALDSFDKVTSSWPLLLFPTRNWFGDVSDVRETARITRIAQHAQRMALGPGETIGCSGSIRTSDQTRFAYSEGQCLQVQP